MLKEEAKMATEKENKTADIENNIKGIPVLTLRDVVVYPHMVIPLFVGREKSIRSLDEAMENNKQILLVAQKSAEVDEPGPDDVFEVGTLATILQLLKLPDGTLKVLVEGAGAVGVAALLHGKIDLPKGSKVGIVLSGGNIDVTIFARYGQMSTKEISLEGIYTSDNADISTTIPVYNLRIPEKISSSVSSKRKTTLVYQSSIIEPDIAVVRS